MESYKLFNFDHPYTAPRKFPIGPFSIEVNSTHCENLGKLRRNPAHTFTFEEFAPVIVRREKVRGETVETAIAHIAKKDVSPSLLYPEVTKYRNIDDLCLLLSFVSGRRVYLENEIEDDHSRYFGDHVVNHSFYQWPGKVWDNLSNLTTLNLLPQFYNVATATSLSDLLSMAAYANAILDSICTKWCKANNLTSFDLNKTIDGVTKEVAEFVETTTKSATGLFVDKLEAQQITSNIMQDIKARIDIIKGPSAIFKMKSFLVGHGLYPSDETEEHLKRLKWINGIRNKFVHDGDIPSDKKYSWDKMAEITVCITGLILAISQYYFAYHVLGITDNFTVNQGKDYIIEYFNTGKFHGMNIFDETYYEFMDRLEKEWLGVKEAGPGPVQWEEFSG